MTFLENLGDGFQFILSAKQANICDKEGRMKLIVLLPPMIDPSLI